MIEQWLVISVVKPLQAVLKTLYRLPFCFVNWP